MYDLITFYWSNDDLEARGGKLTLDDVRPRNYALDQQVRARGNPTSVERVPGKTTTLFRLHWGASGTLDGSEPREAATTTERVER